MSLNKSSFFQSTGQRLCAAPSRMLFLFACVVSAAAQALPSDWEQEVLIESNASDMDRRNGTVVYQGNVTLTQGTLLITADKLYILSDGNQIEKIVAEGGPATYEQQMEVGKPLTKAHGNRIDYYAGERRITLRGDAQLSQQGNQMNGDLITYDMTSEVIKARGNQPEAADEPTGEATSDGRIRVVIQPGQLKGNDSE